MNPEMVKGQIRGVITAGSGMALMYFAYRGWITEDGARGLLNTPAFVAFATWLAGQAWSAMTHTERNAVAVVDAIAKQPDSPVEGVITSPNAAGINLAKSMPGTTTVVAGTTDARRMAGRE